jgi:hypothetical protein
MTRRKRISAQAERSLLGVSPAGLSLQINRQHKFAENGGEDEIKVRGRVILRCSNVEEIDDKQSKMKSESNKQEEG